SVKIPIITSGKIKTLQHIYDSLTLNKASAALAASIFHYKQYTIEEVKKYLKDRSVPVRL
ncbi:MAG TPA: HisA/HisF-related TIM barrel protein, partial [bacterium]|nr:HisA/HisF-related TIM barrel protein [bacterium]